jgi:hypothetical protein
MLFFAKFCATLSTQRRSHNKNCILQLSDQTNEQTPAPSQKMYNLGVL